VGGLKGSAVVDRWPPSEHLLALTRQTAHLLLASAEAETSSRPRLVFVCSAGEGRRSDGGPLVGGMA
jgi:hypothetical protein